MTAQTASFPLDSPAVSSGQDPMLPLVERVCLHREFRFASRMHLACEPPRVSTGYYSTFRSCICNAGAGTAMDADVSAVSRIRARPARDCGELPPLLENRGKTPFCFLSVFLRGVIRHRDCCRNGESSPRDARERRPQKRTKEQCGLARLATSVDPKPKNLTLQDRLPSRRWAVKVLPPHHHEGN